MKQTRREKKMAKNRRIAEVTRQGRMVKRINETARAWANTLSRSPNPNEDVINRLGYCQSCKMFYCFNFAGGISWCFECRLSSSCLKLNYPIDTPIEEDPLIIRQCKPCKWEEEDARTNDVLSL